MPENLEVSKGWATTKGKVEKQNNRTNPRFIHKETALKRMKKGVWSLGDKRHKISIKQWKRSQDGKDIFGEIKNLYLPWGD